MHHPAIYAGLGSLTYVYICDQIWKTYYLHTFIINNGKSGISFQQEFFLNLVSNTVPGQCHVCGSFPDFYGNFKFHECTFSKSKTPEISRDHWKFYMLYAFPSLRACDISIPLQTCNWCGITHAAQLHNMYCSKTWQHNQMKIAKQDFKLSCTFVGIMYFLSLMYCHVHTAVHNNYD